jgi:pilus assembly protein CpaE
MEAMRVGIQEFAALPFDRVRLIEGLKRIEDVARERRTAAESASSIFSFIPAKPGVGASTVALNTALALSRSVESNILLSDLDMSAGMLRFMLRLENSYSMTDVAERSIDLVEGLWPYMVTGLDNLDVLHSGKLNPDLEMQSLHVRQFIEFLRQRYGTLCFDMSGNFESYSLETIHESKRIFLVCTPEEPALHLAREKYEYLDNLDLSNRVSIIINRWPKTPAISLKQIEEQLGVPIFAMLTNDYDGVQKAITQGRPMEPTSNLGKQFTALAEAILKSEANGWRASEPGAVKARKFSDLFSAARVLLSQ